jgi:predicted ATPase
VLDDHRAIVAGAIDAEGGYVDGTEGDSFFATFADPAAGCRAAVAALRGLRGHRWPDAVGSLGVRMGLHVGHVDRRDTGYVGLEVHRAARVGAAAHGGQLLLTAAADALRDPAVATEPLGGHRLKDFPVPEQLFCAVVDGRGAAAFPPPRTLDARPSNLPAGAARLVGREADLERVRAAFLRDGDRLVTLTGRGGTGKTSLALEAASELLDEHPGGVWWVALASVGTADGVLPAIAATLQADGRDGSAPMDLLAGRLRDRGPVLLVLDNLEHLVEAADAVAELLAVLPDLRVLVTSQVPLRLHDERLLPLDTLGDEAALELVRRTASRAGARVDGDDPALLDVCHAVDGLPLALELAAARLRVLTPAQLATRLHESTDLLKDSRREARHRSLQATLDWTLGLLDDEPRALFRRLGAFARPAELEELEAVCGADGLDVLDGIGVLLDVALVRRVEDGDGTVRFGLPEALRQAAAAQLDAAPDGTEWRRLHAEHQTEVAWAARLCGFTPSDAFDRADRNEAEARTALHWARATGSPLAERLAAGLATRLVDNGQTAEALELLEPLIAAPADDPDVMALVAMARAYAGLIRGQTEAMVALSEEAIALARDPATRALMYGFRAFWYTQTGVHDRAIADVRVQTATMREIGGAGLAAALLFEAQALLFADRIDEAQVVFAEALRVHAVTPSKLTESADTFRGDLAMRLRRPVEALAPYSRSLSVAEAGGNRLQVLFDLMGLASALGALGHDEESLELAGMVAAEGGEVASVSDFAAMSFSHLLGDADIAAARSRLGDVADARVAAGRAVPAARRVAHACALARAGAVAI